MPVCPRDKGLNYDIKFCRSEAKNKYRSWCKDCKYYVTAKTLKKKKGKKK